MVGAVAVGTMNAIPALSQAANEQQNNQLWMRATPFSITFSKLSGGNISFSIANKAKKTVTLTGIEIGTGTQATQFWAPDGSQSFRPGQEIVLANESFGIPENPCYGKPAGTYYEFENITLTYTEGSISGMRQVGVGLAGHCSGIDLTSPVAGAYPGYTLLSGYVRNTAGTGLASAVIMLANATPQQSATTNDVGYYTLNVSLANQTSVLLVNASSGATYNYSATSAFLITEYPSTLDFVITTQPGTEYAMFVKNAQGNNAATFTTAGHLMLKGGCYAGAAGSCSSAPDGSLEIRDSSGTTHAYINSTGSLCIEDSNCNGYDSSCNDAPDGSLVLRSPAGTNTTYISPTGALCTIGEVWQYGTP